MAQVSKETRSVSIGVVHHPLDPLAPEEIAEVVSVLRSQRELGGRVLFETVVLKEPPKDSVLNFNSGDSIRREAMIVLLDRDAEATYEAVVSLTGQEVTSWKHIPDVQPRVMLDETIECEAAVKRDPKFREAMKKRGITDLDLLTMECSSPGNFGIEEERGKRLVFVGCRFRSSPTDNRYARPVEGVIAVVDLNKMEVLRVYDYGIVPVPPNPGNYTADFVKEFRTDLKPLDIIQSEGPSFQVDGHEVSWQKWNLRIGFTPREGLVLHNISYYDQGRRRPIIYRASLSELVVPYGDPGQTNFRRNPFDLGEEGIGKLTNSLSLGCDCLGEIYYFDASLNDSSGGVRTIPNAICMHEEDFGILWKHVDSRTGQTEVRRSRRLVISSIATAGNYDYGFFWYFYQDGSIEFQVKVTGILETVAVPPGEVPKYGTLIAPQLNAHIHQHFFSMRLDMSVDGPDNSVYEVNTEAEPKGPNNSYGNAHFATRTLLRTESEAQRIINPLSARNWLIANPSVKNYLGEEVAYKLIPRENVPPFAHPDASVMKRAAFMTKHLWVAPYDPQQMTATGDYPTQHPGGAGLPAYTSANRNVENRDIVLWYTFGHHHIPRLEDWPIMPTVYIGFNLKPVGFFDQNPVLDVPPPIHGNGHCHS